MSASVAADFLSVRVSRREEPFARPFLKGLLQIVPVDRTDNDEMFDNLHDAPRGGGGAEVELLLREIGDLVGQPASSHLQVCDETRALACCKFCGTERNGCADCQHGDQKYAHDGSSRLRYGFLLMARVRARS